MFFMYYYQKIAAKSVFYNADLFLKYANKFYFLVAISFYFADVKFYFTFYFQLFTKTP